jgi:hypothetical protein
MASTLTNIQPRVTYIMQPVLVFRMMSHLYKTNKTRFELHLKIGVGNGVMDIKIKMSQLLLL